jgi:integrase
MLRNPLARTPFAHQRAPAARVALRGFGQGGDVIEQNGVRAIRITPDAGTVKTGKTRIVPLHEHLIEQGLLDFVAENGRGRLFYSETQRSSKADEDITNPKKSRAVTARVFLASWIRKQGITDPEVRPNHAWRHTFKQRGSRHGMREHILDVICGHAPAYVGRGYNVPTLGDMAEELEKFPRYAIE